MNVNDTYIRSHLLDGDFGLEMENLRMTGEGRLSHSPHPIPGDDHIVRDFCENQTEINTGIHDSIDGALDELDGHVRRLQQVLSGLEQPEYLWLFSSPPYIACEDDVPVARFTGKEKGKTLYREYLSDKYGRYKMTFSGIHVNYSFPENLVARIHELSGQETMRDCRDRLYLKMARGLVEYGWILTAVTAASPLLDGSFYVRGKKGETVFSGMASVRCSELGYWNDFIPVLDYDSVRAYSESIRRYIEEGWINAPSELYYPVRLKSRGENNLDTLEEKGIGHLELRMFDLNPFEPGGVDRRDLLFAQLLMVWCCCHNLPGRRPQDQVRAVANYKKAAHFDLNTVNYVTGDGRSIPMDEAGRILIRQMTEFYEGFPGEVQETLRYEYMKFVNSQNRYAWKVREEYGGDYAGKALALAKKRQLRIIENV